MGVQKQEKSAFGPLLILAILLADVGAVIWGWHLYQRRQERFDDAGLDLARAPEPAAPAAPAPVEEEEMTGIDRYVLKEALPAAARPAAPRPPAAPAKPPPTLDAQPAEERQKISRAVRFFFELKNQPRFKNSKAVQEWKRDFLSYPDLRSLSDAWRRDRDPLKFMVGLVRSPNLPKMAGKYLAHADMQAFMNAMMTSPAVMASAGTFMSDDSIKGAVTSYNLAGDGAAAMKDSAEQMGKVRANPALKGYLESADKAAVPPVR